MPFHYYSGGFWMFPFMMPIILIIAVIVFFYFFRGGAGCCHGGGYGRFRGGSSSAPSDGSAMDVLNKRYAKGEITKEEYERIKKDIS